MKHFVIILTALFAFGLAGCSSDEETASKDVTFSGSMQGPSTTALNGLINAQAASLDPTDYKLYCVTFTDPPESGTGEFDTTGAFSVTVANAAGLPVGCFINDKATNTSVATVTFIIGSASGLDDGTSNAAALEGGSYEIVITFDPVTGVATADIREIVAAAGVAVQVDLKPEDLGAEWLLACDEADAAAATCKKFLADDGSDTPVYKPFPIYVHVIGAKDSGKQVFAMGVWESRAAFKAAGATEGIQSSQLPAEITELKSYNTGDVAGASPTGTFNGFLKQAAATYDYATNSMKASAVKATFEAMGVAYDGSLTNDWIGSDNKDNCPDTDSWTEIDLANNQDRSCFMGFLEKKARNDSSLVIPKVDWQKSSAFQDWNNPTPSADDLVYFNATHVANTPEIGSRMTLMDLEISGTSAVARDFWEYDWTEWDEATNTSVPCYSNQDMSIVMVPEGTGKMVGWFTIGGNETCGDGAYFGSFKVNFTKQ